MNTPFLRYNYGGMVTPQSSQGIFGFLPVRRFNGGGISSSGGKSSAGGVGGPDSSMAGGIGTPDGFSMGGDNTGTDGGGILGAAKGFLGDFLGSFKTDLDSKFFGAEGLAKLGSPGQQGGVGAAGFLQQQALPGIAGLLPGAAGAQSQGNSSYDAERLARITGITVAQAQAYLDSMYGKS